MPKATTEIQQKFVAKVFRGVASMLAFAQYSKFALLALAVVVRFFAAKFSSACDDGRAWVTSRTGNVLVVTDKFL
jgi:hypothetical protein